MSALTTRIQALEKSKPDLASQFCNDIFHTFGIERVNEVLENPDAMQSLINDMYRHKAATIGAPAAEALVRAALRGAKQVRSRC